MNHGMYYSLDECMLAAQIAMYLQKTMDFRSQIVEFGHQK